MSVVTTIDLLNLELVKSFANIPGAKVYGVSELIAKKNQDGSQSNLPGVVSKTGEITYVGYDDKTPLVIYHRLNTASQTEKNGSSFGDDRTDQITTYSNSVYVYADRKMVCADQSDLLELIQTAIPDSLIVSGYKGIVVRITTVNFNTQSILKTEYQGADAKLRPERMLIQINYQIETTFRKKCAVRCA